MPDLTPIQSAFIAAALVIGVIVGWLLRGRRAGREKAAINAGWQEQVQAQRAEQDRLTEQNKGLMEQISQLQASNHDAKNRARELSDAVQDAFGRRDELQRDLKEIRTNLERAMSERDQLRSDFDAQTDATDGLQARDARIAKLESELDGWHNRLPPLIERFRERNQEAERLEQDLTAAHARIRELEAMIAHGETRIDPVEDPDTLTDGMDASNDTLQAEMPLNGAADNDDADERDNEGGNARLESHPQKDDLQRIKGVGPAIEKTLNELGITRFEQIADMSEYDIDRVANRLRGFRSRIYREDWIGQARELRDQHSPA